MSFTSPMLFTESGMATLVRLEHPSNALCTRGGHAYASALGHREAIQLPTRLGACRGPGGVSLTMPMLVTEAPMATLVRLEHP